MDSRAQARIEKLGRHLADAPAPADIVATPTAGMLHQFDCFMIIKISVTNNKYTNFYLAPSKKSPDDVVIVRYL